MEHTTGDLLMCPPRAGTLLSAAEAFLTYLVEYGRHSQSTIEAYKADLRIFSRWVQDNPDVPQDPTQMTHENILAFARSLSGAPRTVQRRIGCLCSFFAFLESTGQMHGNPARRIPLPRAGSSLPKALPSADVHGLLLVALNPWERCCLWLLLGTGIRRGELAGLRLGDLDMEIGAILVHGKGNKERLLPLVPPLPAVLRQYLSQRKGLSDTLLVDGQGKPVCADRIGRRFRQLAHKAGLGHVTPHCLRHTFATELVRQGTDLPTVQNLLGHACIETTRGYIAVDPNRNRSAVAGFMAKFTQDFAGATK